MHHNLLQLEGGEGGEGEIKSASQEIFSSVNTIPSSDGTPVSNLQASIRREMVH